VRKYGNSLPHPGTPRAALFCQWQYFRTIVTVLHIQ
jgi:hypothetical protein